MSLSDAWRWYKENRQYFYCDAVTVPGVETTQFVTEAIKRPGALTAKAKAAGAITQQGNISIPWAQRMAQTGTPLTRRQANFFLHVLRRKP